MLMTIRPDLLQLQQELASASIVVDGLGCAGEPPAVDVSTFDDTGAAIDLPPEARPVLDAHVPPPRVIEFAEERPVEAIVRTTSAEPVEVFRFACEQRHLYQASLTISGVDAGNFAVKLMEGRFTWKRITANAIMTGITVVSDLHDTAAASWAPNALPSGTDIVFTVAGAAGRTIDWLLVGTVGSYAPAGTAT